MDRRLGKIPFVKVRVDDILVSGKNDEEHINNLRRVLEVLRESGLTLKLVKCAFFQDEVVYCGYVVGKDGVRPLPHNVTAVKEAPAPTDESSLRSFLGMVNYYNKYLPKLSSVAEALHSLLRQDVEWK